jgi:hypothetical protein
MTGESYNIDYNFYVEELESVINIPWFELHHGELKLTDKFNLGGI